MTGDGDAPAVQPDDGQQLLAGMPLPLYPCTPTRLLTWQECPRAYRFSYLERPPPAKGPPWAHTAVGAAVHAALAAWWTMPARLRTPAAGAGEVRRRWPAEGFADRHQSERVRERAAGWVGRYLGGVDAARDPAGVERVVTARAGTLLLSGRVDRIDRRPDGTLVVVDYKTGRWVPGPADAAASLAMAVYAMAVRATLRGTCHRVELHHLPSGRVAAAEHDRHSLGAALAAAETLGRACATADAAWQPDLPTDELDARYPPRPSPGCSWCDWRRHCPPGQAASEPRRPWDGLTPEPS